MSELCFVLQGKDDLNVPDVLSLVSKLLKGILILKFPIQLSLKVHTEDCWANSPFPLIIYFTPPFHGPCSKRLGIARWSNLLYSHRHFILYSFNLVGVPFIYHLLKLSLKCSKTVMSFQHNGIHQCSMFYKCP